MKYIDTLLQGASMEWKPLGEVFETRNGYTPSKANAEFWTNGTIPWFRMEDIRANGGVLKESIQYITTQAVKGKGLFEAGSIIMATTATIGEHALIIADSLANQRFTNFKVRKSLNKRLLSKFIYYYFFIIDEWCKRNVNVSSFPSVEMERLKRQQFPLPPLPVQQEIVRILDRFTTLEAELEAELEARKKQYEYYRDNLLTFGDEVEWKALGEVLLSIKTGLNPRQFFTLNTSDANHYYITIRELKDGKIIPSDKTDKINDEALKLCQKRSNLEVGDVLFSGTGTIGETAIIKEEPINWNIKEGVYSLKPNHSMITSGYIRHILSSQKIKDKIIGKSAGGTVKSIPMKELQQVQIPLPSLSEQARIVAILDRFDTLVNSISEGLPKEIALRRKQYEYYREQLLSFPKR